jgi:hypothetical protein
MRTELIRPSELMKPDLFSGILLAITGVLMMLFLIYTGLFAILRH